ncbi:hypothetical protein LWI29_015269 [Acer saccharum]|uniref:Uncharacterized protein n=1 Tax=Acer saccharum TaxID=4024 RepID=A0AA39W2X9_ACESA|nr:hypothetical protein LWI29_015269 [Acer saccharum]
MCIKEWAKHERMKGVREGKQISGKDLHALPIALDLEAVDVSSPSPLEVESRTEGIKANSKSRIGKTPELLKVSYWNLEEKIAKVIEKWVALGYVFNSKGMVSSNGIKLSSNNQAGPDVGGEDIGGYQGKPTEAI